MQIFIRSTADVLNHEVDEPGHGMKDFEEGNEMPTISLLKHYMAWYCDSGKGNIASSLWKQSMMIDNGSRSGASTKVMSDIRAFPYWNSTIWLGESSTSMGRELNNYIQDDLSKHLSLVRSIKDQITLPA